jgi:hypothetical protein
VGFDGERWIGGGKSDLRADALLTKSSGSSAEAPYVFRYLQDFLSGGTRIRTGDTMIFS